MSINLDGLVPIRCLRFGGAVTWDDAITIPNGLAIICENMQFLAEGVKGRWGLRITAEDSSVDGNPTGVDVLTVLGSALVPSAQGVTQQAGGANRSTSNLRKPAWFPPPVTQIAANVQVASVFSDEGDLFLELPAGTGTLAEIIAQPTAGARIAAAIAAILPDASVMQTAKAYNRIYQAFSNLVASTGPVLAFDAATGFESPVGQNPIAAIWQPNTFYQQGDIVTSSVNPAVWWRRLNTGYSGATEPIWLTGVNNQGYFTGGVAYAPTYAQVMDNGSVVEWQEWTPGFPTFIPTPNVSAATVTDNPGGGTIAAGKDVYICLSYFNDLGESLWTQPLVFSNTGALDELTIAFGTANAASGPPMPSWLMSIMKLGTTAAGLHWPSATCINVYVAQVAHGGAAPTQFYLYGTTNAASPVVIGSIPSSGTLFTSPIAPTAAISTEQYMGEPGIRNAILLRQNTMGDLSPVDPQGVIPVQFLGAVVEPAVIAFNQNSGLGDVYCDVQDVTQFAIGQTINVQGLNLSSYGSGLAGNQTIAQIISGQQAEESGNPSPNSLIGVGVQYPAGMIVYYVSETSAAGFVPGSVTVPAGPCPVAVVPPGVQEGPGYSYDVLAFTVAGLGVDGPFNYLASPTPASPFSTTVIREISDGEGNGQATLPDVSGLAAGETVVIAGWTGGDTALNGQRVLAAVNSLINVVTFPEPFTAGTYPLSGAAVGVTMSVVQELPTQAVAGTVGILLQFDDETIPEGVDVTGNLLFVALPPCIDLAYLPSVQRMCYVSDTAPTSLIFSETDFMGEIDGLNDVLGVEQSNGARIVGARELLNGMVIAAKETGGYQIIPTADVPANWGINRLWGEHGPSSGRNIGTGRDLTSSMDFFIFVDPDCGVYKWPPTLGEGELDWLSKELSGANNQDASRMATWDRVNRAAGQQIQVVVDSNAKEIKVAVPLDGALTPTHILTMSYFNGWNPPLMMTMMGEWVPSRAARRWNIDPIPTRCMAMVKRTLSTPIDQRVNQRQLVIGQYAAAPGPVALLFMQPGVYDDLGNGYAQRYRPAYAKEAPSQESPNGGRVLRFSAATGHALGAGNMTLQAITDDPTYIPKAHVISLDEGEPEVPGSAPITHFNSSLKGDNEFLTVEFSNVDPESGEPVPGAWFQLAEYTAWHKPLLPTR